MSTLKKNIWIGNFILANQLLRSVEFPCSGLENRGMLQGTETTKDKGSAKEIRNSLWRGHSKPGYWEGL